MANTNGQRRTLPSTDPRCLHLWSLSLMKNCWRTIQDHWEQAALSSTIWRRKLWMKSSCCYRNYFLLWSLKIFACGKRTQHDYHHFNLFFFLNHILSLSVRQVLSLSGRQNLSLSGRQNLSPSGRQILSFSGRQYE